MGPRPHLSFYACKTIWLASEILVSMGLSPNLWFLNSKQPLLDQNYISLWVPDLTYCFFIQKSDFSSRIASLYGSQPASVVLCIRNSDIMTRNTILHGSQTSPVILCMQNSVISPWITSLHGSQTSPVVLCIQNKVISIRITSLYWSQPAFEVFSCKTASLGSEIQVSMGPRPHLWFLHWKERL